MAKQTINIGSAYDDPSADKIRDGFDKVNDNFTENYDAIAVIQSQIGTIIKELVEIGAWDMQGTANKTISWSLPSGKRITSINATIYADTGSSALPINYNDSVYVVSGNCFYNGTGFRCDRISAGIFNSSSFNDAVINRGVISVEYDDI